MAIGQGASSKLALGKETTWGNGVSANEIIPFDSESIEKSINQIESAYLDGSAGKRNLKGSVISDVGDLSGEMVFDEISGGIIGIESILRGSFGNSSRDAANSLNKYFLKSTIDDSYTLAFDKSVSLWEHQGSKFKGITISGQKNESLKFNTSIISKNMFKTGDANIVNSLAGVQGLSSINPTPMIFDDLIFRIGDHSNALASADQISINSFEFSLDNNLTDPDFGSKTQSHTNSKETLEPVRNGLRNLTFKCKLPRYTSDQLFSFFDNGTPLQSDVVVTSGSFKFSLLMPNLYITKISAPISDAGLIVVEVEFQLIRNSGKNTFMTFTDSSAISDEAAIEVKSNRTTAA